MIRLIVVTSALLSGLFILLLGGLRLQTQSDVAKVYFGECAMPCWQQVQPGVTPRADALARLKAQGWFLRGECNAAVYETCYDFSRTSLDPVAYVYIGNDQVREIALFSSSLTLGDLWLAFAPPDDSAISPHTYRADALNTAFWFAPLQISTNARFPCPANFADMLRSPLNTILIWEPGTAMEGTTYDNIAALRLAMHQVCGT